MAAPTKRRKATLAKQTVDFPVKYPEIVIFIVERKIQRFRLDHIKTLARKKGFSVSDTLNESVTHIVSELETREQVLEVLKQRLPNGADPSLLLKDAEIVSMVWFSSCMEEGAPVKATHGHRLKSDAKVARLVSHPLDARACYQDAKYCCQRVTPLNHHNKKLTDTLEVLEKQADFLGGDHNASRALAFRKASAALKALPRPVRSMCEVENLCDLKGGKHCKRIVQEILEEGFSSEVEDILNDEWFQTMKNSCQKSESSLEFRNQSDIADRKTNKKTEIEGVGSAHCSVSEFPDKTLKRDKSYGNVNTKDSDQNARTRFKECMAVTSTDHKPKPWADLASGRHDDRDWVARRVDFIITPQSQYAYAIMGWIGSRMFNRSARDYANREKDMTLTSHGLFDKIKNVLVPARTQREIFEHLKLDYREPHERNC